MPAVCSMKTGRVLALANPSTRMTDLRRPAFVRKPIIPLRGSGRQGEPTWAFVRAVCDNSVTAPYVVQRAQGREYRQLFEHFSGRKFPSSTCGAIDAIQTNIWQTWRTVHCIHGSLLVHPGLDIWKTSTELSPSGWSWPALVAIRGARLSILHTTQSDVGARGRRERPGFFRPNRGCSRRSATLTASMCLAAAASAAPPPGASRPPATRRAFRVPIVDAIEGPRP